MKLENSIVTSELKDILPGVEQIGPLSVHSAVFHDNSYKLPILLSNEKMIQAAICKYFDPTLVLEYGTATGLSTYIFAANSSEQSHIYTVDIERQTEYSQKCLGENNQLGEWFRNDATVSKKITQILRKNQSEIPHALDDKTGNIDLLFIDGDHTYSGVKNDTIEAMKLASKKAVFLWHDYYSFPDYVDAPKEKRGVYPYLNELNRNSSIVLRHIMGTYLVIGSFNWTEEIPGTIVQPGDSKTVFGDHIVRLWETALSDPVKS